MQGQICPFCGEVMQGHLCKCQAYDVVKGFEDKKYKEQPYLIEGYD